MIVDATGYDCPVAKKEILPIPVSRANQAARRSSARTVARLMDEARASGRGLDEGEADLLADEAKHASRGVRTK
jgi:hypothetical protein